MSEALPSLAALRRTRRYPAANGRFNTGLILALIVNTFVWWGAVVSLTDGWPLIAKLARALAQWAGWGA